MAKDESSAVLWFAISVIESMGTVKSRHQAGDPGWQQSMSAFSKRRKLGSSVNQEKAKDSNALCEHSHMSFPRKGDAKVDHRFSFASGQQHETVQISNRLGSSARFSSSAISMDGGGPVTPTSLHDASAYSCQCPSEQLQTSQNKRLEDVLYQQLNLDTHPAVTRLQNEQNQRLEGMEQRMNKIRKNAQQEAERRKFAHLFRARTEEKVTTEKLLKEASVALQVFKKERQLKKSKKDKHLLSCDEPDSRNQSVSDAEEKQESDKGDIIPVRIVSAKSTVCNEVKPSGSKAEPPLMWLLQPVERLELNGIVLWLVLPFLLPLLLLLHLLRHLSPSSECHSSKKN